MDPHNANVDGSVTPVTFDRADLGGNHFQCHRLLVSIQDDGALKGGDYGAISGGLATGVEVDCTLNGEAVDLLDGHPIKTNIDWGTHCHDVKFLDFVSGHDLVQVRWTFDKAGVPLNMEPDDTFTVTINDDLTDLGAHLFVIQGTRRS